MQNLVAFSLTVCMHVGGHKNEGGDVEVPPPWDGGVVGVL